MVTAIMLTAMAGPEYNRNDNHAIYSQYQDGNLPISSSEVTAILKIHIDNLAGTARNICLQMPLLRWIAVVAAGLITLIAGIFFSHFVIAICCACFGAGLSFAGMTLLSWYKGFALLAHMGEKGAYYASACSTMIVFGACVQLLLIPCRRNKTSEDEDNENKEKK